MFHHSSPALLGSLGTGRATRATSGPQDPESAAHVALLRDSFVHKVSSPQGELEYLCMCFEKLESNLRKVGKQPPRTETRGSPTGSSEVRPVSP
ncbi:Ankyrin repeat domain-containing protein 17 [Durusdinium trenchii]|uniref:Ankyrin repeat domain-containing protein 17 n=1 Tax=Durusdinium trenchii TaxID=1381693 RepID=A0ABP0KIX3_9DINO